MCVGHLPAQKAHDDNVQTGVKQIVSKSPAIRQLVDSGKLAIVSGMFNIESGKVEFFEQT
jgi:carbonic anhydrase